MRWIFIIAIWLWVGWALFRITPALGMLYAGAFVLLGMLLALNFAVELFHRRASR